jgi:hypothetical protein
LQILFVSFNFAGMAPIFKDLWSKIPPIFVSADLAAWLTFSAFGGGVFFVCSPIVLVLSFLWPFSVLGRSDLTKNSFFATIFSQDRFVEQPCLFFGLVSSVLAPQGVDGVTFCVFGNLAFFIFPKFSAGKEQAQGQRAEKNSQNF